MALGVIYAQNAFHNIYLDKNSGGRGGGQRVMKSNPEAFAGPSSWVRRPKRSSVS